MIVVKGVLPNQDTRCVRNTFGLAAQTQSSD
jgi:hypothetical protein